jgi:hypothetical protein
MGVRLGLCPNTQPPNNYNNAGLTPMGLQETQGLKFLEAVINYILQATEIEPDKLVQSVASISEKGGGDCHDNNYYSKAGCKNT